MSADEIAVLVATCNRPALLRQRALPSILHQRQVPDFVVVVNDGADLPDDLQAAVASLPSRVAAVNMRNGRAAGVAGAWNTGLEWLLARGFEGFVAILDDDDTWDPQHLAINRLTAVANQAHIVVSGLRLCVNGHPVPRPLVDRLDYRDFLVGNPGWQGSNTFVRQAILSDVGGFDEELPSMHDRDLAVRLLLRPGTKAALVPEWTASWYFGTPGSLSERRSPSKLVSLQRFLAKHGAKMSPDERAAYFERAERMFGHGRGAIECGLI